MAQVKVLHLVTDFRPSGLDTAEVRMALRADLPFDWEVIPTSVAPLSTTETGLAIYQLGLSPKHRRPQTVFIFANCAPRQDDDKPRTENAGEPLVYGELDTGVRFAVVNSGYSLSPVRDRIQQLYRVKVPSDKSQFRTRDHFAKAAALLAQDDMTLRGEALDPRTAIRALPVHPIVASVDGFGLIKILGLGSDQAARRRLAFGTRIKLTFLGRSGVEASEEFSVAKGIFEVSSGERVLAPGSSGHGIPIWEAGRRDHNLYREIGEPAHGSKVVLEVL